jgi:hypothetical protein
MIPGMSRRWAPAALMGLIALVSIGCGAPAPAPTPTAVPVPTATAVAPPAADLGGQDPADIENAFLSNVDDLIGEANDLTVTSCADLTQVTRENPNLLPSLRGFAASMKRVGSTQSVLDTDNVKVALGDLDHTMGQLEGALSKCGITQR